MRAMREGLDSLGEDVRGLPIVTRLPRAPPLRVRVAIALPILAAAAYLFLMLQ